MSEPTPTKEQRKAAREVFNFVRPDGPLNPGQVYHTSLDRIAQALAREAARAEKEMRERARVCEMCSGHKEICPFDKPDDCPHGFGCVDTGVAIEETCKESVICPDCGGSGVTFADKDEE